MSLERHTSPLTPLPHVSTRSQCLDTHKWFSAYRALPSYFITTALEGRGDGCHQSHGSNEKSESGIKATTPQHPKANEWQNQELISKP